MAKVALVFLSMLISPLSVIAAGPRSLTSIRNTHSSVSTNGAVAVMSVDSNHDGVPDQIRYEDSALKITKRLPFEGRYHIIELERRRLEGIEHVTMYYQSRSNRYVVERVVLQPYRVLHQTNEVCDKDHQLPGISRQLKDVLANMKAGKLSLSKAIDKSCSDAPFSQYRKAIEAGVKQVANSSASSSGSYVACLRSHGLETVAASFEDAIAKMALQNTPQVMCRLDESGDFNGSYDEKTGTISFNTVKPAIGAQDESAFFANVFFHEALHKAGYPNETFVHKAVDCCYDAGVSDKGACADMKTIAERQQMLDAYMAAAQRSVGEELSELLPKLGDGNTKEAFKRMFLDYIEQVDKYSIDGHQPDQVFNECMLSEVRSGESQAQEAFCLDEVVKRSINDVDRFLDKNCSRYSDLVKKCDGIKAGAHLLLNKAAHKTCSKSGKLFQDSCLFTGFRDARQMRQGHLDRLAATRMYAQTSAHDPAEISKRTTLLSSYLTAFSINIEGIREYWETLKNETEPHLAEAMAASFFQSFPEETNQTDRAFERCVKQGLDQNGHRLSVDECSALGYRAVHGFLTRWFTTACPQYFKANEAAEKCTANHARVAELINHSILGGCQRASQTRDFNLSCLNASLAQARQYLTDPDSIDPNTKRSIFESKWFDSAYQAKREAARKVHELEREEAQREEAQPAMPSRIEQSIAFDPESPTSIRQQLQSGGEPAVAEGDLKVAQTGLSNARSGWANAVFNALVPAAGATTSVSVSIPDEVSRIPRYDEPVHRALAQHSNPNANPFIAPQTPLSGAGSGAAAAAKQLGAASPSQGAPHTPGPTQVNSSGTSANGPALSAPNSGARPAGTMAASSPRSQEYGAREPSSVTSPTVSEVLAKIDVAPYEALRTLKAHRSDSKLHNQLASKGIRFQWGPGKNEFIGAAKPRFFYVFRSGRFVKTSPSKGRP